MVHKPETGSIWPFLQILSNHEIQKSNKRPSKRLPTINKKTKIYFLPNRTCNSCDSLASPNQHLPSPGQVDLYQPLITPSQQQLQHQNSQIYTCSSECSDHSARHNHHFHNVSSSLNQHHTHHRPPSNNHTLESVGVVGVVGGAVGSLHFDNIQTSQHQQHHNHHPPSIVCGKNTHGDGDSEKEVMLKRCGCNNEPSDNDISEGRNCSECCSNSKDDGDTCSCSEGSCLYAEAGDPQEQPPPQSQSHIGKETTN